MQINNDRNILENSASDCQQRSNSALMINRLIALFKQNLSTNYSIIGLSGGFLSD